MEAGEALIGAIYEAGALPDRWPATLERIAAHVGARGGNLIRSTASGINILSSPTIAETTEAFDRQGWNQQNSRVERLIAKAPHPAFLTDLDLHTIEEIHSLPIYVDFLTPMGADAGAATLIQGADNDGLIVAMEAFRNHAAARDALPLLDRLRPHLARAVTLSSQVQQAKATSLVDAFNATGMAMALLDRRGKAIAATDSFVKGFDDILLDSASRLRLADPDADRGFVRALSHVQRGQTGYSLAIRNREKSGCAVLHLLPASRDARDLFNEIQIFALLARPENRMVPGADIIGALFDLTPAEARVARGLAQGLSPAGLSRQLNISVETVRTHLKKVFTKTSTTRQSELTGLLARLY